ncbi:hypothetical protein JOQ06_011773 [Pogonophryne albipinna]|uniref:Uncharacterized protein n=1 Tax=Pogonophryne albipinna TaxID=1090488 RepID=A0AAD6FQ61_9TELE|nr:hypothetical protein JOQ06_011773 [Pogonophryne albipinna]
MAESDNEDNEAFLRNLERSRSLYEKKWNEKEDPSSYLKKRPLPCPVLIVSSSSCLLAIGDAPIATFPKQDIAVGAIYLMAYYYAFHLTYPKCVATLLSVIQTEILLDKIHDKDLTPSYKKGMAEWKAFLGQ